MKLPGQSLGQQRACWRETVTVSSIDSNCTTHTLQVVTNRFGPLREQLMRDDMLFQRFAAAIYSAYDAVVATGKVGAADGSVSGPQVDATLLASDPLPQRFDRQTIATMVAECKTMDTVMAGREKMI